MIFKLKKKKKVMHNKISHHSQTNTTSHSWTPIIPFSGNSPSLYSGHDVCCGISLWPDWVSYPSYAPSQVFSFPSFLPDRAWKKKIRSPWLRINMTKQKPKHQCVIIIILLLNPKHSPVPVIEKKLILSSLKPGQPPIQLRECAAKSAQAQVFPLRVSPAATAGHSIWSGSSQDVLLFLCSTFSVKPGLVNPYSTKSSSLELSPQCRWAQY